jgi:hypothetical protein
MAEADEAIPAEWERVARSDSQVQLGKKWKYRQQTSQILQHFFPERFVFLLMKIEFKINLAVRHIFLERIFKVGIGTGRGQCQAQ